MSIKLSAHVPAERNKRSVLPDVAAFLFGLSLAWFLKWETRDLVWSLWLSSLCVGYATILGIIGAGLYLALALMLHEEFKRDQLWKFLAIVISVALFLLLFFSFHFCAFHSGHAAFLIDFFPLKGIDGRELGDTFGNPPKLLYLAIRDLFPLYGWFLICSVVSDRYKIFGPFLKIHAMIKEGIKNEGKPPEVKPSSARNDIGDPFFEPYKNIIKMHCLIFFFGFAHILKIDNFFVFAVAYAVYFFPWSTVWKEKESALVNQRIGA